MNVVNIHIRKQRNSMHAIRITASISSEPNNRKQISKILTSIKEGVILESFAQY
jgi:hypothetical protein